MAWDGSGVLSAEILEALGPKMIQNVKFLEKVTWGDFPQEPILEPKLKKK